MAFANTTTHINSPFGTFSFARITAAFSRGMKRMQIARMNQVLESMTNQQLRLIGITRGEIEDYAEMLIIGSRSK